MNSLLPLRISLGVQTLQSTPVKCIACDHRWSVLDPQISLCDALQRMERLTCPHCGADSRIIVCAASRPTRTQIASEVGTEPCERRGLASGDTSEYFARKVELVGTDRGRCDYGVPS